VPDDTVGLQLVLVPWMKSAAKSNWGVPQIVPEHCSK